jgi:hypothetical protein
VLREEVKIITTTGEHFRGHLFVGAENLPELEIEGQLFRPATTPNAWTLQYVLDPDAAPILSSAWQAITRIQSEIAAAQREDGEATDVH